MTKSKQFIFIDDAGDAGFKFKQGSSRYFVIACVVFSSKSDAEYAGANIKVLRRKLNWKPDHEFKFNKNRREHKIAFLSEMKKHDFTIRAIVVDKTKIHDRALFDNSNKFYLFIIREVLDKFGAELKNARICLDGKGDKEYRRAAATYFRQELNKKSHRLHEFKLVDSKTDGLIQLADMIAGSIYRSLQKEKSDSNDYLPLIRKKLDDLWFYGQ